MNSPGIGGCGRRQRLAFQPGSDPWLVAINPFDSPPYTHTHAHTQTAADFLELRLQNKHVGLIAEDMVFFYFLVVPAPVGESSVTTDGWQHLTSLKFRHTAGQFHCCAITVFPNFCNFIIRWFTLRTWNRTSRPHGPVLIFFIFRI